MVQRNSQAVALSVMLACLMSGATRAEGSGGTEGWRFGIGTGLSSFSLDGDLGFATPVGGVIGEIDLDNSETSDLIDSALGANAFATNGKWTMLLSYGTVTLEDSASDLEAEWDRTTAELAGVYTFAEICDHRWGILAGVRRTDHEWTLSSASGAFQDVEPEDDWTDFIAGLTHSVPFAEHWSWRNRIDAGFGDTEQAYTATTAVFWQPLEHWQFNINAKYSSTEFGDDNDINDGDFYFYDVDETSFGLGVSLVW